MLIGLIVVASLGLGLFWGALTGRTASVPGEPSSFDPVRQLPEVASFACPGCKLVEMSAEGVSPDGTVNLSADYTPRVHYEFESGQVQAPSGPIGTGGPQVDHWRVDVAPPGMVGSSNNQGQVSNFYSFGMTRGSFPVTHNNGSFAIDPPCSFTELWEYATEHGAPENAVAWIAYDRNGYEFAIRGTKHRFLFDADCAPRER